MTQRMKVLVFSALVAAPASAQSARPADVATPQGMVRALYETVTRRPGQPFDWVRGRSLYAPTARLIPNLEQTGGEARVLTVNDFIAWVDQNTTVGGPDDKGFEERQVAVVVGEFGDIAHAFSTYEKGYYGLPTVLGRGINTVQMIRRDGRWWITQIAWDEESAEKRIPARYLPKK